MNDNTPPWPLLARYMAGEVTSDERRTIDDWTAATDANQRLFDQLQHRWLHSVSSEKTALPSDSADVWDRYVAPRLPAGQETPVRPLPVFRRWLGWMTWPMAAAVAGLLLHAGYRQFIPSPTAPQVAATTTGKRMLLTLTDGSRVWLNADSKLEYPKKFDGSLREVRLTGEAFFDVAHNPKQPFVIRLATASIRVLGTSFNVRAYPGDATVETTVVTGRVAFVPNKPAGPPVAVRPSDTTFVLPNHHAIQAVHTLAVTEEPVVAANETAWKENRLVFEQTTLRNVARTLERWYGLPVYLAGGIDDCPLTATFSGQSLREVLDLIGRTGRFEYELTTEKATISGHSCR